MYKKLKSIPDYAINEHGEVMNIKRGTLVEPYEGTDGYMHIILYKKGKRYRKRVHRLMAEAWLNNAAMIDHIDGDRTNNELSNLRACTNQENVTWGVARARELHGDGKMVKPIVANGKRYSSIRKCAKELHIDRHKITLYLRGLKKHPTIDFSYAE